MYTFKENYIVSTQGQRRNWSLSTSTVKALLHHRSRDHALSTQRNKVLIIIL